MRGSGRLSYLTSRAPAWVGEAGLLECSDGVSVDIDAIGLAHGRAVPFETQSQQVRRLAVVGLGLNKCGVEILVPQQKTAAARPGEKPGEQRRSQIADMEIAGGARCEPAGGHLMIVS